MNYNEDANFLRWWEQEKHKYPSKARLSHVAQAAYAAWCARAWRDSAEVTHIPQEQLH
jgi:hypothetical protein